MVGYVFSFPFPGSVPLLLGVKPWQPLGPLLKVKLLVGYIYPLVVHVAQWLIGELVSDQHKLVWKSDEIKNVCRDCIKLQIR